jgi:hypothetical protein
MREQTSAGLPSTAQLMVRRIRAGIVVERAPEFHRYIGHISDLRRAALLAVHHGHSAAAAANKGSVTAMRVTYNALK